MRFTKRETNKAMSIAMKLRKEYSIKLNCKFNDVSLSICLKEAYEQIKVERNKIVKKFDRHYFSAKEISHLNGWNKFKNICREFDFKFKNIGSMSNTYMINCCKEDFVVIKEMIKHY